MVLRPPVFPLLALVVALLVPASAASAAVTCDLDGGTLSVSATGGVGEVALVRQDPDIVVREDGSPVVCGGDPTTVGSVDRVEIWDDTSRSITVTLDLRGGPFVDGGGREIVFDIELSASLRSDDDRLLVLGSPGSDHFVLGSEGINLNSGDPSDSGVDVLVENVDLYTLLLGGGDDTVDGAGSGQAGPFPLPIVARGGDGADTLTGGAGGDLLRGETGPDALSGGPGRDELLGGPGDDLLAGGEGDDVLEGGHGDDDEAGNGGDDIFDQGGSAEGADALAGGDGRDTLAYDRRSVDLVVTLDDAPGDGEAGELDDAGSDIEVVLGGAGNDDLEGSGGSVHLRGGAGDDVLRGLAGDDVLLGDGGDDVLAGGAGLDTASFFSSSSSVRVRLAAGVAAGQGADSLSGIENARGGPADDVLIGDEGPNLLFGDRGDDLLVGGEGDDVLLGGAGVDWVSHVRATGAVIVSLRAATARGEGSDTIGGVEAVKGGPLADRLRGDRRSNRLVGGPGDDRIAGAGGPDVLLGGRGGDILLGGSGSDLLVGGPGLDRCRPGRGRRDVMRGCP